MGSGTSARLAKAGPSPMRWPADAALGFTPNSRKPLVAMYFMTNELGRFQSGLAPTTAMVRTSSKMLRI